MCGRYNLTTDPAGLALELDAVDLAGTPPPGALPDAPPRIPGYNIAPTSTVAALTGERIAGSGTERALRAMRWGLVPSWAKDTDRLPLLFNARVETAAEKPSFRSAVRRRHCVVPMDGWYEWVPDPGAGGTRSRPRKQPYLMTPTDGSGLLMAGLWESREVPGGQGERLFSCTILTTAALGPLQRVHDRMPLVVPPAALADWLDPEVIGDPLELVQASDLEGWAGHIDIRAVSTAVSSVRNDSAELREPVADPLGLATSGAPAE